MATWSSSRAACPVIASGCASCRCAPASGAGVIEAIEEPSPQRVEAPCPYFGHCGGCRLQHMAYPAQLAFKAKQVVDALERLGGLKGVEVRPIIGATETFGYRNKMEFTVARGAKEPLVVGLHEADRYDSVLDIDRCLLQSDRMNALLGEARAFFVERGLTVYDQDSGEGLLRFLMLREGTHTGELMANVVTSAPAVSELAPVAPRLQARDAGTTSVVMNVNPKKASVAVGVEEHLLGGRDHIRERVGGLTFQVSASSFFQTNTRQAERLFELVLDSAELTGTETVYDLYSGTGAISLLLARRAAVGLRRRGGPGRGGRRGGQRGRQRHHQLHVRVRGGPLRAALPDREGGHRGGGGGRSAARGVPSQGAARADHARRAPHRLRVVQPHHAGPRPGRAGARRLPARVGAAGGHVPAHARTSRRWPGWSASPREVVPAAASAGSRCWCSSASRWWCS